MPPSAKPCKLNINSHKTWKSKNPLRSSLLDIQKDPRATALSDLAIRRIRAYRRLATATQMFRPSSFPGPFAPSTGREDAHRCYIAMMHCLSQRLHIRNNLLMASTDTTIFDAVGPGDPLVFHRSNAFCDVEFEVDLMRKATKLWRDEQYLELDKFYKGVTGEFHREVADKPMQSETRAGPDIRRMRITPDLLTKYGFTDGCAGCRYKQIGFKSRTLHSERCRARIWEAMETDEEGRQLKQRSDERIKWRRATAANGGAILEYLQRVEPQLVVSRLES